MEEGVQLPTYFDDLETVEDEAQSGSESKLNFEVKVPSLIDLCTAQLKNHILLDGDFSVEDLSELPPHLFEALVMSLPAAALEILEQRLRSEKLGDSDEGPSAMKKFKRPRVFNEAWRNLFETRFLINDQTIWPEIYEWGSTVDWLQAYWQRHLQECIDFATEQVFQPSYKGQLSQMPVSTKLLEVIGYKGKSSLSMSKSIMLSYHCQRYGQYARCLKIRNVICTSEICGLLKTSELKGLLLRRIRTNTEVDALCELLQQNMRSLISLRFIDSTLSSNDVERICHSLCSRELGTLLLQHLIVINSRLGDPNGCEPFLRLGRSLKSISVLNTVICKDLAERFFNILINTSSSIEYLDLSDNNISGWFSKLNLVPQTNSLKSLCNLTLRGNNMRKTDIDELKFALKFLPNLHALDLNDNPIGDEGIGNLISCILDMAARNSFLKHLKLDNCLLSCKGVTRLFETLSGLGKQLWSLSIADNNLGSGIAAPLSRFLSTSIRDLNVDLTGLGDTGFTILERELGENLLLENINISRNRGKSATAKIISKLISNGPRLQTIKAAQNLMPPESMLEICSTLQHTKGTLKLVDLTGNIFDPSLEAAAKEFMLKGNGKPVVILPSFESGPFIHDDDP